MEKLLPKTPYHLTPVYRLVEPYEFEFKTHAKFRWLGKPLYDVLINEYSAYKPSYYVT